MNSRWQALKLFLDTSVVVVIEIFYEVGFEMLNRIEFLQVQELAFE